MPERQPIIHEVHGPGERREISWRLNLTNEQAFDSPNAILGLLSAIDQNNTTISTTPVTLYEDS